MRLQSRTFCPLCDSKEVARVLIDELVGTAGLNNFSFASRKAPEGMHYRMVICKACDVAYANPAPDTSWLHDQYVKADFDTTSESRHAARNHGLLLQSVLSLLPDRGRALDIGAGDGAFLNELRALGFAEVEGIEPSSGPLRCASPDNRQVIHQGFFSDFSLTTGAYSLITCFQTIEHVEDAKALAEDVIRLLKPGGLFLVVCHDFRALSARLLKHRSPIFDIEHLQLFSPVSLLNFFNRAGYQDIVIAPFTNRYPIEYWLKLAPTPRVASRVIDRAVSFLRLAKICIPLRAGNLYAYGVSK